MVHKVPRGALRLSCQAELKKDSSAADGPPKLHMIVYSGGIVKDHWYWNDLILDLAGVKFPKSKIPILENHSTALKIAYHDGKPIVDKNLRFDPDRVVFVSTPESERFRTLAAEGFPYEASVQFDPHVVERVDKDATAEANGLKIKGPASIIRKWSMVEGSVCTFGYDPNTSSAVLSKAAAAEAAEEVDLNFEEVKQKQTGLSDNDNHQTPPEVTMDIKELFKSLTVDMLSKERPDLLQAAVQKEQDAFTVRVSALEGTVKAQSDTIAAQEKKALEAEKRETLRAEKELKLTAEGIWEKKLSASKIPVRLHAKVKLHVNHESFMKDGTLDETAFAKAVGDEVAFFEKEIQPAVGDKVLGSSFPRREEAGLTDEDKEDDAWVDSMVAMSGQPA